MKRTLNSIMTLALTLTTWSLQAAYNPDIKEVDIDIDHILPKDDPDEHEVGGFVGVGEKTKIILRELIPSTWAGPVELRWTNPDKVKVTDAVTGALVPQGAPFTSATLPKELFVEGLVVSGAQGDVRFILQDPPTGPYDWIALTVVDVELKAADNHTGGGWASPDLLYDEATCSYKELGIGRYCYDEATREGARKNHITLTGRILPVGVAANVKIQWSGPSISACYYNPGTSASGDFDAAVVVFHKPSVFVLSGIDAGSHTFTCSIGLPNGDGTDFISILCQKDVIVHVVDTIIDHVPNPVLRQQDIDVPINVSYDSPQNVKVISGDFVAKYCIPPLYINAHYYEFTCPIKFVVPYANVEYSASSDVNGTAKQYTLFSQPKIDNAPMNTTENLLFQSKNSICLVDGSGNQMTETFQSASARWNNQITFADNNINTMTPWQRDGTTWDTAGLQTFATDVGGRRDSLFWQHPGFPWMSCSAPVYFNYSIGGYGFNSVTAWVGDPKPGAAIGGQDEAQGLYARNGYALIGWPKMKSPYTGRYFLHEAIMSGKKVIIETGAFYNDTLSSGGLVFESTTASTADPWVGVPTAVAGWLCVGAGAVSILFPPGAALWAGAILTAGGLGIELVSHNLDSPGAAPDSLQATARLVANINGGTPYLNVTTSTALGSKTAFGPAAEQQRQVDVGDIVTWGIEMFARANNRVGSGSESLYIRIKNVYPDGNVRIKGINLTSP